MESPPLQTIARMHSDFSSKFGIPRQSGMVPSLQSTIVFEPAFRDPQACRGLEDFSHLWLLWGFSANNASRWWPTVRPPRLGGNKRMGVFATRSPFRPNAIGLSCVRLDAIEQHAKHGTLLHVSGADLMDGTPIYDIKPYLRYTDCHPEAADGFVDAQAQRLLHVDIPPALLDAVPPARQKALCGILAQDPRPSYQQDAPGRQYGLEFAGLEVKFTVEGDVLTVFLVEPIIQEEDI